MIVFCYVIYNCNSNNVIILLCFIVVILIVVLIKWLYYELLYFLIGDVIFNIVIDNVTIFYIFLFEV